MCQLLCFFNHYKLTCQEGRKIIYAKLKGLVPLPIVVVTSWSPNFFGACWPLIIVAVDEWSHCLKLFLIFVNLLRNPCGNMIYIKILGSNSNR